MSEVSHGYGKGKYLVSAVSLAGLFQLMYLLFFKINGSRRI